MKIVYIHDSIARIGGVERIFTEKMNYFADSFGYEVYLITCSQGNHPFVYEISSNIKHIDLNINFHLQYKHKYLLRLWVKWKMNKIFRFRLSSVLQDIKPHIIIGTTWKGDVICRLKCDAKKIIESHTARSYTGIDECIKGNFYQRFIKWKYLCYKHSMVERECDVIISLTKGDANEWNKAKRIEVIPNTTSITLANTLSVKTTLKKVISVGRLSYQKGYDRLINAWEIIKKKHPNWSLDVYGDEGELKQQLEAQISELNMSREITIHPPTNKIMEKYQEYDFYVMSSRYEGWGLVLVEAMTCGIPCIAFDCPYGPSDIIEHEKNGLLVKNGDIQGLADAICWMIEHEEERKQMGLAAKETSKKYVPEVIMKQWDKLFKELVKQ